MQTFLPHCSFICSAKFLDYRRLGKQRVEAWQLLLAMDNPDYGWRNHPAFKMWNGYSVALAHYGIKICQEWIRRGYKDTMLERFMKYVPDLNFVGVEFPSWLGDEKFHASHRSNLLRKDPIWYGKFGWTEPDNLEYVWPV